MRKRKLPVIRPEGVIRDVGDRDFDFDLPAGLIAQEPAAERGGSRLLSLNRETGAITHFTIAALPTLLDAGDLLVINNTRVFPARLIGHRVPSGGRSGMPAHRAPSRR